MLGVLIAYRVNSLQQMARRTFAVIDRPPGKPADPKVREFLRYALSREGQADIEREPGYLPLSAAVRDAQTQSLD